MACQHGADHHHGCAEPNAFGDVAVFTNAAICNDGLGGHACAPLERRELPAASAKTCFEFGDADLAGTDADLGRVRAPSFQIDHCFRRAHVACDDECIRQMFFQMRDHAVHVVRMTVRDVDGDVVGAESLGAPSGHGVVIGLFHAQ